METIIGMRSGNPGGNGGGGQNAGSVIVDATIETFGRDVLEASLQVPVIVDFWAPWCGPCKQLTPVLEKLVLSLRGAVRLVKVNVDENQMLAQQLRIQSIPTVMAFRKGRPVDGFQGALPESQVREFLRMHGIEPAVPAEAPPRDPHAEVVRLRREIEADPDNAELKLELALALLQTGGAQEAEKLLDALPANLATDDRAVRARARLGFAALLRDAPPAEVLEAAVAADPRDLRARHLLGTHHLVAGRSEEALEQFLEMLRIDRDFGDGLPRKALIDAFRVIEDAELVGRYRRKMSSILF